MFGGGLQGTSQKSNSALVSRVHSWWIRYPSVYSYSLWWLHNGSGLHRTMNIPGGLLVLWDQHAKKARMGNFYPIEEGISDKVSK